MLPFLLFPSIKIPFLFRFYSFFFSESEFYYLGQTGLLIQNPSAASSGALGLESKPPFLGPGLLTFMIALSLFNF